ncbi:MAG: hypothetical protein WEC33_03770 [Dehalococcoidia bacterium]
MKRYTIYLKDGRAASVYGSKFSPDADRPFQGQARNFVIVASEAGEAAAFLSNEVIGWTSVADDAEPVDAALDAGFQALMAASDPEATPDEPAVESPAA